MKGINVKRELQIAKIQKLEHSHDIKDQFEIYKILTELDEINVSPVQMEETRKAFYAGFSQMHLLMKHKISNESDEKAFEIITSIEDQTKKFWSDLT